MLGSLVICLKGMRRMMFQVSGFDYMSKDRTTKFHVQGLELNNPKGSMYPYRRYLGLKVPI